MLAMGCKEQALAEIGPFKSFANEGKLAHALGFPGGSTLTLSGAVSAREVKDH